jgi:hypothetical protein
VLQLLKKEPLPTAAVFLVLLLSLSPIFGHHFGYSNDYSTFTYDNRNCCLGFPETKFVIAIGRPLQAILLNFQLSFITGIQSLEWMRLLIVTTIAGAASLFFLYLRTYINIRTYSAALLSVLAFIMPSMTIASFWICQSIPGIIPVYLVIFAHALMQRQRTTIWSDLPMILAVFSLLFLSLMIYPPATFLFLTLTFIKLMFGKKDSGNDQFAELVAEAATLIVTCIAYFLSIKFILKPILLSPILQGNDFQDIYDEIDRLLPAYKMSLSFDPATKIGQIEDLYTLVFSSWAPPLDRWIVAPLAASFVAIVLWAAAVSPYFRRLKNISKIGLGLMAAVGGPIVLAVPVLAGSGSYPLQYRVLFASMVVFPAALVFAIDRASRARRMQRWTLPLVALSLALLAVAEIFSYQRLTIVIARVASEYQHVVETLQSEPDQGDASIRIPAMTAPPPSKYFFRDYIFSGVGETIPGMVIAAAREIGRDIDQRKISFEAAGAKYQSAVSDGIIFGREGYPSFIESYKGISGREPFGRWTDSDDVAIIFTKPLPPTFIFKLSAGTSSALVGRSFQISVGNNVHEATFMTNTPSEIAIRFENKDGDRTIHFKLRDIKSPLELGEGLDSRRLGLALVRLQIVE